MGDEMTVLVERIGRKKLGSLDAKLFIAPPLSSTSKSTYFD